jgi:four helix bundle protein
MAIRGADFRNLVVWKRSHQTVLRIYQMTRLFPSDERFGLTSQLRRAAVSIPSNIAEGSSRMARGSYRALVDVALGSAGEVDYQLLLAKDLGYMHCDEHRELASEVVEIRAMLAALYRALDAP